MERADSATEATYYKMLADAGSDKVGVVYVCGAAGLALCVGGAVVGGAVVSGAVVGGAVVSGAVVNGGPRAARAVLCTVC